MTGGISKIEIVQEVIQKQESHKVKHYPRQHCRKSIGNERQAPPAKW